MAIVMGVDSSTQSTKVELRELDSGQVVATGRAGHPPTTPPRSEQDPRAWWRALVEALHPIAAHLGDVVAVSVAGQQHGLVVLDEHGAPLRHAKLWNDTESATNAAILQEQIGPDGWAAACGSVPTASFTITKLAWLAEHEPDVFARTAKIMLPHDYLTWRLTGAHVTDRGDASGTGWWSPGRERYDDRLLSLVGEPADLGPKLPTVLGPTAPVGPIADPEALALGLPSAVVGPGTGDNMAGALGLGLRTGDVAVSIGTSGTVYAVSATPTADATGAVAGFADATGNYLPLVCTLNATKVTDAIAGLLGFDPSGLSAAALEAEPGAGGVVVVPYFDGERTPDRPEATGSITGIRSDIDRPRLARAAFEGVVCGLLDGLDALIDAGVSVEGRSFLIGGGAKAEAYRRILAGLTQRPIVVPASDETVATGACVQAASVAEATPAQAIADRWGLGEGETVEPDAIDAAAIRDRYRQQATRFA